MDGRYPASTGHRRLESMKNPSPIQSPHSLHHWSNDVPTATRSSLPRSKSDMDISRVLLKVPSSSQLSYNLPHSHSRSEIFSLHPKEGKQGGMKLLISKSSKLLQKRRSSNKSRSFDWQQESDGRSRSSNKHTTFSGLGKDNLFFL